MATTVKELIEILQKWEDPEAIVCWQYYTKTDVTFEEEDLSDEVWAKAIEQFERFDGWEMAYESLKESVYQAQQEVSA